LVKKLTFHKRRNSMNEEEKAKEQAEEQAKKMEQLIAKTWADEVFKQRLMSNPVGVLKEAGVEVPEGIKVVVVEDTETIMHLVLPPKPSEDELSEEELSQAAGGNCSHGCRGCGGCRCGCGRGSSSGGCSAGCLVIRPCC
jgi:hypothetical protein